MSGKEMILELLSQMQGGSRTALARLISLIEREEEVLAYLPSDISHEPSYLLGVTGAPGAGKSTLTDRLIEFYRGCDEEIAVLAIDPTSPFSGGAILGDRVRMQSHALDPKVFIRSMATRGSLGGLSVAVPAAVRLLDSAGFDKVIVETVGVGQVEVDIVSSADTTLVVVNPLWGDSIQANKAGLLEIADVFVINKADREGVRQTRKDLEGMLDLSEPKPWRPKIIETVALDNKGVDRVAEAVLEHKGYLWSSGELALKRRRRAIEEFERSTKRLLERYIMKHESFSVIKERVAHGDLEPAQAAKMIVDEVLGSS
ncbi:LAO/AO transport system kinase [Ferrithrix thermotolerans DSM 19514]|uniref:LAO/AO transport system kinase n=2 Tax=Ferrithrix TaxID=643949 RepID=A0A1M4XW02_9ACTN|nr:LAO/AO transport system kinase [Ferrithrix thermotolerans DSM 19514]